jgi:diaminopimelate epimerase
MTIEWRASDNHVIMTGPVEMEAEGTIGAMAA